MWVLRAYDTETDELEREFTLPEAFLPPRRADRPGSRPLSRFAAHDLAGRYGLPIPQDARISFSLDFERED